MDQALLNVAAGMRAHMESLDVLSNNIANASTSGYKADRDFYRLFRTFEAMADPATGEAPWMPVVQGSITDFQQGSLVRTEAPLDVGLSGPGFLVIQGPAGALYSRGGSLARSSAGVLVTSEGYAVLDPSGAPISIPENLPVEIAEDGIIAADGLALARFGIVEFDSTAGLTKAGRNYFRAPVGLEPRPAAETVLHQGHVEASNVNVPEQAVRLLTVMRNFEMMRRVASLVGEQMDGRAVEVLGRTS